MRLYIAACCSILVYGSKAWILNKEACKCINGANAFMLSHITGKTKKEEATVETMTFNMFAWIRTRRLRRVGHILRLKNERLIKQTLKVIWDHKQEGDILVDVEEDDWDRLQKLSANRDKWKAKVNKLKTEARRKTKPERKKDSASGATHSKAITRFTFFPKSKM